jgi:hypothetical protein
VRRTNATIDASLDRPACKGIVIGCSVLAAVAIRKIVPIRLGFPINGELDGAGFLNGEPVSVAVRITETLAFS